MSALAVDALPLDYGQNSADSTVIKELRLDNPEDSYSFHIEREKRGAFSVFADKIWDKDFPTSFLDRPLDTSRNYAPERSIAFSRPALSLLEDKGNLVEDISLAIDTELRALTYLGPLRRQPERDYVWNKAQPGKIGGLPRIVPNLRPNPSLQS